MDDPEAQFNNRSSVFREGESDKTALDKFQEKPHMDAIATPGLDALQARQDQKVDLTHMPKVQTPDLDVMRMLREAKATKLEPILLPVPNQPLPPREIHVWPLGELGGSPAGRGGAAGAADYPLKIVLVSSTSFKVIAGSVAGFSAALVTITSVTTTKAVWVRVTQGYGSSTGIWTASALTDSPAIQTGSSYPSADSTHQIVKLGIVTCAGSVITGITQESGGNQWVARTGNGTTYVDANGSTSWTS